MTKRFVQNIKRLNNRLSQFMKKLIPHKRLTRYVLATLLLTGLFIYGCKKDFKETAQLNNPVIDEAKSWYETEYPANTLTGNTIIQGTKSTGKQPLDFSNRIKPDWKHFANYKRLGKDVIEMPINPEHNMGAEFKNMTSGNVYSDKKYNRTYFLLLKDSVGYKAYVMMIMADPAYVKDDFSKLNHNTYQKHDADFSGLILYFTPKGRYLGGYKYINGQLTLPSASQSAAQVQGLKTTNQVATQSNCVDWYLNTYYDDGTSDSTYIGTTCDGPCNQAIKGNGCPTGPGMSTGPGEPSNPPAPPTCNISPINQTLVKINVVNNGDTGAPPPTDPCDVNKITNNVKDPCLNKMVQASIDNNIKLTLSQSMNSIFGLSANFNLTYTDAILHNNDGSIDYKTDGNTTPLYIGREKQSGTGRILITSLDLSIVFNNAALQTASKEFISATILHEALHAYFRSFGGLDDHDTMVNSYIPWFESSLKSLYPTMDDGNVQALAYGGLTSTMAFSISAYSTSSNTFNTINQYYKDGTWGSPCN